MTPSRPGTKSSAISHAPLRADPHVPGHGTHDCLPTLGGAGRPFTRGAAADGVPRRPSQGAVPADARSRCQHGGVADLSRMRRDYTAGRLTEDELAPTWVEQFDRWFADAVAEELPEPNAVVVATADADGAPDARIVLMKGYASAKGAQLAVNPRAALVFPWHGMQRQVRVAGRVERIGDAASDALWDPRPRGAQLAALASVQSTVVASRAELEERVRLLDEETGDAALRRPPVWGGYRVVPDRVEFWQGGPDRLHDRLRFRRDDEEGGGWVVERLAP